MSEHSEVLERFRRGAELLAVATTGAAGVELDFTPGNGKWSVRTIACHLADAETVLVARLRAVIAEDNPTLQSTQQNNWATRLDYHKRKISQAIETFRRLRGENYELLKDQPDAAFDRTGTHTERGLMTLRDLLRVYTEHLESHVSQIQATRAAYKEHKAVTLSPTPSNQ